MLLLLPLATARTSTLSRSSLTATTPTAATTATPTAASTAAAKAPTPATTPTTATTSAASTTSTAAPTTTPTATAPPPPTLALADAALPTSRSSLDVLSTKDVNSSSRGVGGGNGGGGTPLKEGRARRCYSSRSTATTLVSAARRAVEDVLEQQRQARSNGRLQRRTVPVLSCAVRSERIRLTIGGCEWLSEQQCHE
ncbi:unnamed protein product [Closterium sp. NIES-54]